MRKPLGYHHTKYACFVGYITQAVVNNFAPLLFLTFQYTYSLSLQQVTLLITFNFATQFVVDVIASKISDRVGYRRMMVSAHLFAGAGLVGLAFLPGLLPGPFAGLLLSVCLYAIGGGIIEVLVSPIVEACPGDKKAQAMSLLHSFYCWGYLMVVLLSTLFFYLAGIQNWRLLACLWALIPLANALYFTRVPIKPLVEEDTGLRTKQLFSLKTFWIFLLLMACAGAAENSISQWSSAFAEQGLNLPKAIGDLAGPCLFAICMGCSRVFYARFGSRIPLKKFMAFSGASCVLSYLLISLSPWPALALAGCALCGLSVAILWPGTFSLAAKVIPTGGTVLFGMLALGGDLGCSLGPTLVGVVSGLLGGRLQAGILTAACFPALLLVLLGGIPRRKKDLLEQMKK